MAMTKDEYISALTIEMDNAIEAVNNMTIDEFEAFNAVHGDAVPSLCCLGNIQIDDTYQREISQQKVNKAIRDYDTRGFRPICIGERSREVTADNGEITVSYENYCNDGQHRLDIAGGVIDMYQSESNMEVPAYKRYIFTWKQLNSDRISECIGFDIVNNQSSRVSEVFKWRCMHMAVANGEKLDNAQYVNVYDTINVFLRNGLGFGRVLPINPFCNIGGNTPLEEGVHYKYNDYDSNANYVFDSTYCMNRVFLSRIYNNCHTDGEKRHAIYLLDTTLKIVKYLEDTKLRMTSRIVGGILQFLIDNDGTWRHQSAIHDIVTVLRSQPLRYIADQMIMRNKFEYSPDGRSDNTISSWRAAADVIAKMYMKRFNVVKRRGESRNGLHTVKYVGSREEFANDKLGKKRG